MSDATERFRFWTEDELREEFAPGDVGIAPVQAVRQMVATLPRVSINELRSRCRATEKKLRST